VRGQAAEGQTYYQGFAAHHVGPNGQELPEKAVPPSSPWTIFPDPRTSYPGKQSLGPMIGAPAPGPKLAQILDGTSNTFLVAEAGQAVPWTKPQDIPFPVGPNGALPKNVSWPKLGGLFDGDFHVIMVDGGSLHFVKKDVPAEKLWPFVCPNDGLIPDYPGIGLPEPKWITDLKNNPPPKDGDGKTEFDKK
jgi:hypothetical protein